MRTVAQRLAARSSKWTYSGALASASDVLASPPRPPEVLHPHSPQPPPPLSCQLRAGWAAAGGLRWALERREVQPAQLYHGIQAGAHLKIAGGQPPPPVPRPPCSLQHGGACARAGRRCCTCSISGGSCGWSTCPATVPAPLAPRGRRHWSPTLPNLLRVLDGELPETIDYWGVLSAGFAKAAPEIREQWDELMFAFFETRAHAAADQPGSPP